MRQEVIREALRAAGLPVLDGETALLVTETVLKTLVEEYRGKRTTEALLLSTAFVQAGIALDTVDTSDWGLMEAEEPVPASGHTDLTPEGAMRRVDIEEIRKAEDEGIPLDETPWNCAFPENSESAVEALAVINVAINREGLRVAFCETDSEFWMRTEKIETSKEK